jgi:hypothetical protein
MSTGNPIMASNTSSARPSSDCPIPGLASKKPRLSRCKDLQWVQVVLPPAPVLDSQSRRRTVPWEPSPPVSPQTLNRGGGGGGYLVKNY